MSVRECTGGDDTATRTARHDLARLNYPPENWVIPRVAPGGRPLLDVLVVGGGMMGQTAAFALRAEGIANMRVVDRAEPGREGPWVTFARMPTLRSPKHVNGPDLGIPSLTYRAWFEARHGAAAWDALGKIDRADWHDYLAWVRATVGVAVENRTTLTSLDLVADGSAVRAELARDGRRETVLARVVVLAFGRGTDGRRLPSLPALDPDAPAARARVFHSSDDIDFARLAGRRVAVVGAGASAFDNAGTALEAGAAEVTLFARRARLPQRNYFRAFAARPWPRGFPRLPDRARWNLFTDLAGAQVPPPFESVARCEAFANFRARLGEALVDVAPDDVGVTVTTTSGSSRWDTVILCTGFDRSPLERSELALLAPRACTWADRVGDAAATKNPTCARYPYLGPGYELVPRGSSGADAPGASVASSAPAAAGAIGADPGLGRVHVFDWSAMLSLGTEGGDIPGLELGAVRLASAIAGDLFLEDAPAYEAKLRAYADRELEQTRLGAAAPAVDRADS